MTTTEAKEFQARKNTSEIGQTRINDLANDNRDKPLSEKYSWGARVI